MNLIVQKKKKNDVINVSKSVPQWAIKLVNMYLYIY